MKTKDNILNNLISDKKTNWKNNAKFRKDNKAWLDKSAIIALKILNHLKENGISQKELAEKIGVSPQFINKIIKGNENLTLQTITNIEMALGLTLIEVNIAIGTARRVLHGKTENTKFNEYFLPTIDV